MKFNLKLFVLVVVFVGLRDVLGMEKNIENKDYDGFIVDGLKNKEEAKELNEAIAGKRVIKAVYKAQYGGVLGIISTSFKDQLSYILVCYGDNVEKVEKVETGAFKVTGIKICYDLKQGVKYTVYFVFNNELLNSTASMFTGSQSIISADFRYFDTKNVTDMSNMFDECDSLTKVFLPSEGAKIKKRCICCGDGPVCWNNHEVEDLGLVCCAIQIT